MHETRTLFIRVQQTGNNDEKIADIKQAISGYIGDNCNCRAFSPQYIVDANLVCGNDKDNEFIFIGSILSTGELNSTVIRDTHLQDYLLLREMVNVAGQMIQIDPYCSALVLEEETYRCLAAGEATHAPISGQSAVNLAIEIAIGAGAGLFIFLLLFIGCFVLCLCCARRDVRTKYKEPRTEDLSIQ